jgi:hypothetical protein
MLLILEIITLRAFIAKFKLEFVFSASTKISFDLCRKLDTFLGPQLSQLASGIGDQFSRRANSG